MEIRFDGGSRGALFCPQGFAARAKREIVNTQPDFDIYDFTRVCLRNTLYIFLCVCPDLSAHGRVLCVPINRWRCSHFKPKAIGS